jgi:hypothetical protein
MHGADNDGSILMSITINKIIKVILVASILLFFMLTTIRAHDQMMIMVFDLYYILCCFGHEKSCLEEH